MCFASIVVSHMHIQVPLEKMKTIVQQVQCLNYTSFKRKKNKAKASDFTADMEVGQTTLDNYDNDSMVNKILKFFT